MQAQLEEMIEGSRKRMQEIADMESKILTVGQSLDVSQAEIEYDRGFEKSCMFINEAMHKDAKTMTVLEYETAIKILKERNEEYEKIKNKHKK